jgi:arginase
VIVAQSFGQTAPESGPVRPVRPILAPIWLGTKAPGVHLGAAALEAALRRVMRASPAAHGPTGEWLLPSLTVPMVAQEAITDGVPPALPEVHDVIADWCGSLADAVEVTIRSGELPIVLGGDHSLSWGSVSGASRAALKLGVIWIDAHADLNTPDSSLSGNHHGMPLAFLGGLCASAGEDTDQRASLGFENLCYLGLRDVDPFEQRTITAAGIWNRTMDEWRRDGIGRGIEDALAHLAANGVDAIHVSFDVDVLDPGVFPATGTPVADGLDVAGAMTVMQRLGSAPVPVASLDVVELNPLLDESGSSTEIAASLLAAFLEARTRPRAREAVGGW